MSANLRAEGTTAGAAPPGIDVPRVTAWLREQPPELEPPLRFTRVGDGQSALSYRVDDAAGRAVVLRRPPLGEILASAHNMAREHHIMTGLGSVGARVPRTLALCEDTSVTGAPFYVMEHVDGVVVARVETAARLSPATRAAAAGDLVTTLVELQRVDLDAAGLSDLRRDASFAARQLRTWTRQWHASKTRELPLVDELAAELAARAPSERETILVHGDYRLDNAVLADDGTIRAVLDWELCTVGDPLADVGLMIAYWTEQRSAARRSDSLFKEGVTQLPGFPTAGELADAYFRASGRDRDELDYWVAFAYWKIAVIIEGVYRRWLNDPANGSGAGTLPPVVPRLAARANDALVSGWQSLGG